MGSLRPAALFAALERLPTAWAAVALLLALSMLCFGLKAMRVYLAITLGLGAFALAKSAAAWWPIDARVVLGVSAAAGAALGWFMARQAVLVLSAIGLGFGGYWVVAAFLEQPELTWIGFVAGMINAALLNAAFPRFAAAVFFSTTGSAGVVLLLGQVLRMQSGPLAPRGYLEYPLLALVVATVLFLLGMVLQVMLAPDPLPRLSRRRSSV